MMYPCRLAHFCKQCESCDVSQSSGYFDKWNYDLIAFYSRDYVQGLFIYKYNNYKFLNAHNNVSYHFSAQID